MSELDLGYTPEKTDGCPHSCAPDADSEPKTIYPQVSFDKDAYDRFKEKYGPCDVGDEYEMTVKVRVSGIVSNQYSRSITFEVRSVVGDTVVETKDGDEAETETEESEDKESEKVKPMKERAKQRASVMDEVDESY